MESARSREYPIAAQTRAVLETLRSVLTEVGSSLDRVLKGEVYLVNATNFYEFKLMWRQYFPHEPPARTTASAPAARGSA